MMEISYRHTTDLREGSAGFEQAKVAISNAPLGRIGLTDSREEGD